MPRKKPSKPYYVSSQRQLLALASPGREDIIDAVGVLGPSSVPEIAQFLGRPRNALYYHITALRDRGLLIETTVQREGIKTTSLYDLPGRPMIARYDLSSPGIRGAVVRIGRRRFRTGERGFVRACKPDIAVTQGPMRNLWVSHWKGWLTDAQLKEANVLFNKIVDLYGRAGDADKAGRSLHEITFAIAPVV
ncbi:MAG TPA: helix-turn-helix domain-containing protein [Gemmatimonadaceae bacterium]|nr:helix-turn-helix domain-containing protein [Gemmatimonadaceae bacterium]